MNEVWVAWLAFLGTIIGSLGGVVASSRLTNHRLQELEKKVDKHNHLVERMAIVERDVKSAHRRLDDVRDEIKEAG